MKVLGLVLVLVLLNFKITSPVARIQRLLPTQSYLYIVIVIFNEVPLSFFACGDIKKKKKQKQREETHKKIGSYVRTSADPRRRLSSFSQLPKHRL